MMVIYNVVSSGSQWEAVPAGSRLNGLRDPERVTWNFRPRKLTESWDYPQNIESYLPDNLLHILQALAQPKPLLEAFSNPNRLKLSTSFQVLRGHASLTQQCFSECGHGTSALVSMVGILLETDSWDPPLDQPFQNLWGWSPGFCIFKKLHRCRYHFI